MLKTELMSHLGKSSSKPPTNHADNAGVVLFVALAFLFVSTLIGISSLRSTYFSEKMAFNSIERERALEAAEAALFEGEQFAVMHTNEILEGTVTGSGLERRASNPSKWCNVRINGVRGVCVPREVIGNPARLDVWIDTPLGGGGMPIWTDPTRHFKAAQAIADKYGLAERPKFIIEFMGYAPEKDRASACAQFRNDGSPNSNADMDQLASWPYCERDPALFRITTLATAGNENKTRVMLQSTYTVGD